MYKPVTLKRLLLAIVPLLTVPSALAASSSTMQVDFVKAFEIVFGPQGIGGLMHSTWGNYGITLVFYFLLFYSVFGAALRKVRIFEGEGSLGLNSSGKMFAIAISALSCLSIFAFKDASQQLIKSVLSPMGIFGGLALGIIFFIFIYRQFKDSGTGHPKSWALLLTGVLLFAGGSMIGQPDNMLPAIGIIMIIIGIVSFFVGIRRGNEPITSRDDERAEHTDRQLENQEVTEQGRVDPFMEAEINDAVRRIEARQQLVNELSQRNEAALNALRTHIGRP